MERKRSYISRKVVSATASLFFFALCFRFFLLSDTFSKNIGEKQLFVFCFFVRFVFF